MSESSVVADLLADCRDELRLLADADHEQQVDATTQLKAQNAVAAGIAVLASEPTPQLRTEAPERPILAKDLLITIDLVLRALQSHRPT